MTYHLMFINCYKRFIKPFTKNFRLLNKRIIIYFYINSIFFLKKKKLINMEIIII